MLENNKIMHRGPQRPPSHNDTICNHNLQEPWDSTHAPLYSPANLIPGAPPKGSGPSQPEDLARRMPWWLQNTATMPPGAPGGRLEPLQADGDGRGHGCILHVRGGAEQDPRGVPKLRPAGRHCRPAPPQRAWSAGSPRGSHWSRTPHRQEAGVPEVALWKRRLVFRGGVESQAPVEFFCRAMSSCAARQRWLAPPTGLPMPRVREEGPRDLPITFNDHRCRGAGSLQTLRVRNAANISKGRQPNHRVQGNRGVAALNFTQERLLT